MLIVAVDPGLTGACSVFDSIGLRGVFDLPTMQIPGIGPDAKVKDKIDCRALVRLLRQHWAAHEKAEAVMELIQISGGAGYGIQTQVSLLRTVGAIEAVLECLSAPIASLPPKKWQKFFGLTNVEPKDRKSASLLKARSLYPTCQALSLAKHHNRAESILIGHWYLRHAEKKDFTGVPF